MFEIDGDDHWIPLADLMTGLMVIFLLISVTIMVDTIERHKRAMEQQQKTNAAQVAAVRNIGDELRKSLAKSTLQSSNVQFESDTLIVRFRGNLGLFNVGSNQITPQFKEQLIRFFPEYLQVVKNHESEISTISIDGYASSFWGKNTDAEKAYFLNMGLSQQRAKTVLEFIYHDVLLQQPQQQEFIRTYFTANGYSSSHFIMNLDGQENTALSQRVEFKIILKK